MNSLEHAELEVGRQTVVDERKHVNVTTRFLLSEGLLLLDVLFHPLELAAVRH